METEINKANMTGSIKNETNFDPLRINEGVACSACNSQIKGFRYKCAVCPDYDLCSKCEEAGHHPQHFFIRVMNELVISSNQIIKFTVPSLLFHLAYRFFSDFTKFVVKFEEEIHFRTTRKPDQMVNKCSQCPDGAIITDFRYVCLQCEDHVTCKSCETNGLLHPMHHIILRIPHPDVYSSNSLKMLIRYLRIMIKVSRGPFASD